MSETEQLQQAITALEAQRAILGDAVADIALAPLRARLAAIAATTAPAGNQRKQVTILFADVSGFTAMSEAMDPEEVGETMNALWTRLDAVVTAHGGTIDKHIGDAIMGLFGTPVANEDDPERAVRAALAMQSELRAFAERHAQALRMRIGINTGAVMLGAIGTTGEYTAMGDAVNLASRLEHAAPVGSILISHDTYRHIRGVFNVQPLAPLSVKGKAEPVVAYEVQSAKPRAFRVPTRGVEGIETRTIGRKAELDRLKTAMAAATDDRAVYVMTVVGEAGMGKSRLLYEFNNWLDLLPHGQQSWLFKGRATQEMTRLPYALLRDILAFRFDIQDSDRAAVALEKLVRGVAGVVGAEGEEMAHFIGHLIGLDISDSPFLAGIRDDARQIRDRAFHYIARFLSTLTADYPAVMFLEDIHWADDSSLDLIDYLEHSGCPAPLLVVGLTRPSLFERRPQWGAGLEKHAYVELRPLSDEATRALVTEILRKLPAIPPKLLDLIAARADGSPFYVEELIKMLIEDGVIVAGEGAWQIEPARLASLRVPPTLTGILQARLDSLAPHERATLQQASVVGRVFWSDAVEHLHRSADRPQPDESLRLLTYKELIFKREPSAFAETQEFIFKHSILRDVTYESVLKRVRRDYHAQVAAWLSDRGERAGEYAGLIGEHFERAGDTCQAAEWYARAAKQARKTYAPEAAIDYSRRALAFWQKDCRDVPVAQLVEAYEGLGEMLNWQGHYDDAAEAYAAMRATADEAAAQARAELGLAMARDYQGDHRAALESARHAEQLAAAPGTRAELAMALRMQGQCLFRLGDTTAALKLGQRALALSRELGDNQRLGRSLNLLGAATNILGRYAEARNAWEEALAVFNAAGDRRMIGVLLNNLGVIAEAHGDDHAAYERYRDATAIAGAIGHRNDEMVYRGNLAGVHIRLGEYAAAERDLLEVVQMAGATGGDMLADTYRLLAEAYLGQNKLPDALATAIRSLELGRDADVPELVGTAWRMLGTIASSMPFTTGELGLAGATLLAATRQSEIVLPEECFAESLRIFTEAGMAGERANTLRAWASHALEAGDQAAGAPMWHEARDILADLGADLEVERMDRARPELSGEQASNR
jgi:class 3 adenylate cyclase/predicted ATPase